MRSNIVSTGTGRDGDGPLYEVAVSFDARENPNRDSLVELIDKVG